MGFEISGCELSAAERNERLAGYAAGTLPAAARYAFERHLEECPMCRELAGTQQAVWAALDHWTPPAVSAEFDRKLFERLAAEQHGSRWRRLFDFEWSWRPAVPVGAACAVLAAAFLLRAPAPHSTAAIPPSTEIEQVERALDDIDMLKQLGVAGLPDKAPASERM
jgi:anti-sigma-K factor RskA